MVRGALQEPLPGVSSISLPHPGTPSLLRIMFSLLYLLEQYIKEYYYSSRKRNYKSKKNKIFINTFKISSYDPEGSACTIHSRLTAVR